MISGLLRVPSRENAIIVDTTSRVLLNLSRLVRRMDSLPMAGKLVFSFLEIILFFFRLVLAFPMFWPGLGALNGAPILLGPVSRPQGSFTVKLELNWDFVRT